MARLIVVPGGSEPLNEGERRVVAELVSQLPDDYWVIPNVEVAEPNGGQRFEYDAIVIAPHAVYVIETKDWWGRIQGDDREWLVNGRSRKAPTIATERKARVLKSKLVDRAPALARVWVEPVVALASIPQQLSLSPDAERSVFQIDNLITFLVDAIQVRQRPRSIADLSNLIIQTLDAQVRPRSGPLVFGSYEVTELLEQNGEEATYQARHRFMPGAPPVRLRVVTLSPYLLNEQARSERRTAVYRENEALLRMGSHPNVVAAREVFEDDDGRIVVVLDGTEGRSLRQRMFDGTPMTVEERLDVLADVCRALAHAHVHGVIHRRVEPESILLTDDGTARLARFGLAKLMTGTHATVWHDDTADEVDRRYLAPELDNPALGSPSPASDLYELGCVAYELFAGRPPFDTSSQAFGVMPPLPNGVPTQLQTLLAKLVAGDPARRPLDAKDVLAALESLRARDRARPITGPKDQYESGDVIDGKFEVREKLGGGGFSTVYRVYWSLDDREYAIKVFNMAVPYDKVQREITLLRQISHPHIVRAVWADQTRAGQWYLVTELVRGEMLEAYADGRKRLSVAEAVQVTKDLLSALEAIHPNHRRIAELKSNYDLTEDEYEELQMLQQQGIVHRDIKPQNLLLTTNGIVLIDFNIASRVGQPVETLSGTPRYQDPDVTPGLDEWNVAPDLFAAGIVLYELLCCEHPYLDGQPRMDFEPRDPRQMRPDLSPQLAEFLLKACAPYRNERFATAVEMHATLEAIDPLVVRLDSPGLAKLPPRLRDLILNAPPNVNPMVHEFLSLASQARRSNRGTRGLDDLAEATYVETRLDDQLSSSVLAGKHRLVIITGNAGDGKTAFIQQLEVAARKAGAMEIDRTLNGTRLRYAGQEIWTLYDGSQDEVDRTSDDVLQTFFAPFRVGSTVDRAIRLAAINEGRLRDFLLAHRLDFPDLAPRIIATLDEPGRPSGSDDVVVVNLNLRSVTAGGDNSIFSRQLRAIVDGPFWEPCEKCDYRTRCPLKHNVDTFRDSTSGPAAIERLRILVDLVRLRRRRHLTMRDVRSLLSHVLFRDRVCEEIPALLNSDDPFTVLDIAYFQGPGGAGVPDGTALERNAALMTEVDIGLVANPEDDRAIAIGAGPRRMSFPTRTSEYPTELIATARARAGSGYETDTRRARRVHEAARRQFYFERADDNWWVMLPYERLREFEKALSPQEYEARLRLRAEVVRAVSMYEGIQDVEKVGDALWLATNDNFSSHYRCFRRFPLADFDLRVVSVEVPYVEAQPDRLQLVHQRSRAILDLDIDLLEVLDRLREGFVPSADEGRGFLVNLALFKHQLLAQPSSELLIANGEQLMRIALGSAPGSVVLSEERM